MATRVEYNGVTMHNVATRQWDQTVLYDDAGNAMAITYNLVFQGLIHAATSPLTNSPTHVRAGGNPASATAAYKDVRKLLAKPRRTLKVYFGDQLALEAVAAKAARTEATDVENGPRPKVMELTRIAGDRAFHVVWSVSTTLTPCGAGTTGAEGWVLSNRWDVRESMDEDYYVTRTISGQLRLGSSPTPNAGVNWGHAFKWLCIPGLESGFRRLSVDFTVARDGRTCDYSVTDRQTRYAAPYPATRMNARHSVGSQDGVNYQQSVSVSLSAPPHVHIRDLFQRAMQVALFRLDFRAAQGSQLDPNRVTNPELANGQMITSVEVTEEIGDATRLDLIISTLEVQATPTEALLILPLNRFGSLNIGALTRERTRRDETVIEQVGQYKVNRSRPGNLYGYEPWLGARSPAVLQLLHCFTEGPCDGGSMGIATGRPSREGDVRRSPKPVDSAGTDVTISSASSLNERPNYQHVSASGKRGMYMNCRVASRYVMSRGVVAIPLAEQGVRPVTYRARSGQPVTTSPPAHELQASAELFELSGPQAYRVFDYDCERFGGYPKLPQPIARVTAPNNFVAILAHAEIGLPAAHPAPDGAGFVYRAKARYVYLLNRPPTAKDSLDVGRLPFFDPSADAGLTTYDALFNEQRA